MSEEIKHSPTGGYARLRNGDLVEHGPNAKVPVESILAAWCCMPDFCASDNEDCCPCGRVCDVADPQPLTARDKQRLRTLAKAIEKQLLAAAVVYGDAIAAGGVAAATLEPLIDAAMRYRNAVSK